MPEDPKQVMRDAITAYNERGIEGLLEYFHSDVVWRGPPDWIESETFRGHEGVRTVTDMFERSYAEYRFELDDVVEGSERVVALGRQVGRSQVGGHSIEQPLGLVVELRDGMLWRLWSYLTWDAALEAEGLEPRG